MGYGYMWCHQYKQHFATCRVLLVMDLSGLISSFMREARSWAARKWAKGLEEGVYRIKAFVWGRFSGAEGCLGVHMSYHLVWNRINQGKDRVGCEKGLFKGDLFPLVCTLKKVIKVRKSKEPRSGPRESLFSFPYDSAKLQNDEAFFTWERFGN